MEAKKKHLWAMVVILIIIAGGLFWWHAPVNMTHIEPEEVSKIKIFDGNTGKPTIIIEPDDIKHIIENLNKVSLKKEKISMGYMGYSFRVTIYIGDNIYKEFYINSEDTIRKDPFFYHDISRSIDYDFIKELIEN
ncbi:MAG: hypothetical protein R6U08_09900 [Bacillota bacterium]